MQSKTTRQSEVKRKQTQVAEGSSPENRLEQNLQSNLKGSQKTSSPEKETIAVGENRSLKIQVSICDKKTKLTRTKKEKAPQEFKSPEKRKASPKPAQSAMQTKQQAHFAGLVPKPMAAVANKSLTSKAFPKTKSGLASDSLLLEFRKARSNFKPNTPALATRKKSGRPPAKQIPFTTGRSALTQLQEDKSEERGSQARTVQKARETESKKVKQVRSKPATKGFEQFVTRVSQEQERRK